jgi:UDP-N-acetylglucosamine 4,6-dehydratase
MKLLVTGGTGSLGSALVERALTFADEVIVYSRDELKQSEMAARMDGVRFILGDVRDPDRLLHAMRSCDVVVHTAAMKRVPECEANPCEAVETNVNGSRNVARVASRLGISCLAISTDKAVAPMSTYGVTKYLADRLFLEAGHSVFRCGNIFASRGSVVPLFASQRAAGVVTITDPAMTRYSITVDEAVTAIITAMNGPAGLTYVPKMASYRIGDVAEAVAPECAVTVSGTRPGERLHECLITETEAPEACLHDGMYVIGPGHGDGRVTALYSDQNEAWLTVDAIRAML